MKNLKMLIVILCSMAIVSGCSKDQKLTNWLSDGTWTTTSVVYNGQEVLTANNVGMIEHVYDEVKMKNGPGTGTSTFEWTDTTGTHTQTTNFTYTISEKGTRLETNITGMITDGVAHECVTNCSVSATLTETSKDRMIQTWTDDNGETWVETLEKN